MMTNEPNDPGISAGLKWAAAYVAGAVALYFFVVWGWPGLKAALPAKFWAVF